MTPVYILFLLQFDLFLERWAVALKPDKCSGKSTNYKWKSQGILKSEHVQVHPAPRSWLRTLLHPVSSFPPSHDPSSRPWEPWPWLRHRHRRLVLRVLELSLQADRHWLLFASAFLHATCENRPCCRDHSFTQLWCPRVLPNQVRRSPSQTLRLLFAAEKGFIHKAAKQGDGRAHLKSAFPKARGVIFMGRRSRVVWGVGSLGKGNWT